MRRFLLRNHRCSTPPVRQPGAVPILIEGRSFVNDRDIGSRRSSGAGTLDPSFAVRAYRASTARVILDRVVDSRSR
jgi:hypothetical protein